MSKYRLVFDIDLPDDISQDDEIEFEAWLEHFIGCVDDDIYSCNPLNDCDIDVNSSWDAL